MTTKNLVVLGAVAAALAVAATLGGKDKNRGAQLNGQKLVPAFDIAEVAAVEIGDQVKLAAGDEGWTVATLQDYPADVAKIRENLIKLQELKVGQVARGRELREQTPVVVRAADGRELAALTLGERHEKWGFGRYAAFKGETVLVGDALDAFGDEPIRWCETKIVDTPYVSFRELAAPELSEEELGFATGVVAKVTIAGDTNRVATIGNVVKGGTDRYLKLDGVKWTFIVPSYSVDSLLPKPEPESEVKAEAETKPEPEIKAEPEAKPEPAAQE